MPPTLLVSDEFPPNRDSVARTLGELARHWPPEALVVSTGETAESAAFDETLALRVDRIGVPARRLRTLRGLLFWSRRVVSLARELDPEFIWCGNIRPSAYPAKWTRERVGVPYGIMVHGADLLTLQHRLHQARVRRRTVRSLVGSASVVVANSRWTRERCDVVLGELGIGPPPDRIRVVPLGTDPRRYRPAIDTDAVRRRYGLEDGKWLLTVAKLAPNTGVDLALRSLSLLRAEFPDLRHAVIGTGPQERELEAMARELGVADRVRFLTDVPDEDLPALYNVAVMYVGPSRQAGLDVEGFALALLEASASALPVVAARTGGGADAVREDETGVLVDFESPDAVAAAIRALLGHPERAKALGAAGRRAVETFFNWDRVVTDLRALSSAFRLERSPTPPP
ncbi:MAG TPA: glycosyltransferase family 4 protein [Gemmatimonadales bacterium]